MAKKFWVNWSADEKRKFRHAVAVLKKQGVIPASIDARKAQPTDVRGGKSMREYVKKYDDIVSGKATPVKLAPSETKAFKAADYETVKTVKGEKIIIPHDATEVVTVRGGKVEIAHPSGITRVQIPVAYHNLEQYLSDILEKSDVIDRMKTNREYFAFHFFGHRSHEVFSDIVLLIESLQHYNAVEQAISKSQRAMNSVYRNLEIVKIKSPANWERGRSKTPPRDSSGKNWSKNYNRRRRRLEDGPKWKQEEYKNQAKERAARWRAKHNTKTFKKKEAKRAKEKRKRQKPT